MKAKLTPVYFFLLYIFALSTSSAAHFGDLEYDGSKPLYFKKISTKDGLSQSSANCFTQDHLGFIWIGTDDGLNRYDGNSFVNYTIDKGSRKGLSNRTILDLMVDKKENLWIGTAEGLNHFNILTEEFTQYSDSTIYNFYSRLLEDTIHNKIWLSANAGGLKYLDMMDGNIYAVNKPELQEALVRELFPLNDNQLLIGTLRAGVFLYDIEKDSLKPYLNDTSTVFKLPGNKVRQIIQINGLFYIGIEGHGVVQYDPMTQTGQIINASNSKLSSNMVYRLQAGPHEQLLIGTDGGGFNIYDPTTNTISPYLKNLANPRTLSSNVIRSIFVDSEENIWLGTYTMGINMIPYYSKNIYYDGYDLFDLNSLSNNKVTSFAECIDGGMWIGTDGGGLNHIIDGNYTHFLKEDKVGSINDNVIMCLEHDQRGRLVIGTFRGGLNILENGRFKSYTYDEKNPNSISNNWIWDLEIDGDGNYWVGTNNGLNKFDPTENEFKRFTPGSSNTYLYSINNIRSLLLDSKNNLWIGSFGGFGLFNLQTEQFEYFINSNGPEGLTNDIIVKMLEGKDGSIWVATFGGGLNLFDPVAKTFINYNENHGLPSSLIQSLEEDDNGNLWISTVKGIARFNPENKRFMVMDEDYGLQSEIYKHNSSLRTSDGRLYFGGINGYNYFDPDSVEFPILSRSIIFDDLELMTNANARQEQGGSNISNITFTDKITIPYADAKIFTINYTLPDFSNADDLIFAYRMEGFSDQWNTIGKERKITFTSLEPGRYVLKVRATISSDWQEEYTSLEIRIIPPFYRSTEFIFVCVVLGLLLIVGIIRLRTQQLENRRQELEFLVSKQNREIKKQNSELKKQNQTLSETQNQLQVVNTSLEEKVVERTKKLNQTVDQLNKSISELDRFVYSASHDLSAPLKSIKGLVNIARVDTKNQALETHLNYIEESILKLEDVINDLIHFSRNSRSEVLIEKIELLPLVQETISSFQYLPEFKNINFDLNIPEGITVESDLQRLKMILQNLIGNSIKYSDPDKGQPFLKIDFCSNASSWNMQFIDNGIGIADKQQSKVFDMFYRATELSEGTGLGLFIVKEAVIKLNGHIEMKSNEHYGTEFELSFPAEIGSVKELENHA